MTIRVGVAVATVGLRASLQLWLQALANVSLRFAVVCLEAQHACGTDAVLAELTSPGPRERLEVESFLHAGTQARLVVLSFYPEAWKAAVNDRRVTVLDLGSFEPHQLQTALIGKDPRSVRTRAQTPLAAISDRDRLILRLVASGEKNAAIARLLNISSRTIQARMSTLMEHHGVSSRAALMARIAASLEIRDETVRTTRFVGAAFITRGSHLGQSRSATNAADLLSDAEPVLRSRMPGRRL